MNRSAEESPPIPSGAVARPRGRHIEAARNDLLVLEAARDVVAAYGADAPVSAIAARAGVGVGSLYRRYGSKTDLLRHLCLLAMRQYVEAAHTALREADAWAGLVGYIRACVEHRVGALSGLAGTIDPTEEMGRLARLAGDLRDELVVRAHRSGALRADATSMDVTWLIELFARREPGGPGPEGESVRQRLLCIAVDGLAGAPPTAPLPGSPPGARRHHERRWETAAGSSVGVGVGVGAGGDGVLGLAPVHVGRVDVGLPLVEQRADAGVEDGEERDREEGAGDTGHQ